MKITLGFTLFLRVPKPSKSRKSKSTGKLTEDYFLALCTARVRAVMLNCNLSLMHLV